MSVQPISANLTVRHEAGSAASPLHDQPQNSARNANAHARPRIVSASECALIIHAARPESQGPVSAMPREGRIFFFEKKKQKTFVCLLRRHAATAARCQIDKSLFAS